MNTPIHSSKRDGFIIVVSLTLMLVMMTMGIGLYYSTKQSSELVGKGISKSDSFYSAESCIAEARLWLKKESKAGAPLRPPKLPLRPRVRPNSAQASTASSVL